MRGNKRGQIWIETVIYTLVAFVMIGLVLTFVKPKLIELQDQAIIEQSLVMMQEIDNIILDIKDIPGNKRLIKLEIKKGSLKIDGENDKLFFEIESNNQFSEPDEQIDIGGIEVVTQTRGNYNLISLTKDYSDQYNIKYDGREESKTITKAAIDYTLSISNDGTDEGVPRINIVFS